MILSETLYIDRQPVGMIRQNSNTGQISFSPTDKKSLIQARNWSSIDELKAAVSAAYSHKEEGLSSD